MTLQRMYQLFKYNVLYYLTRNSSPSSSSSYNRRPLQISPSRMGMPSMIVSIPILSTFCIQNYILDSTMCPMWSSRSQGNVYYCNALIWLGLVTVLNTHYIILASKLHLYAIMQMSGKFSTIFQKYWVIHSTVYDIHEAPVNLASCTHDLSSIASCVNLFQLSLM